MAPWWGQGGVPEAGVLGMLLLAFVRGTGVSVAEARPAGGAGALRPAGAAAGGLL